MFMFKLFELLLVHFVKRDKQMGVSVRVLQLQCPKQPEYTNDSKDGS